jgi:hypothetical protein
MLVPKGNVFLILGVGVVVELLFEIISTIKDYTL